MLTQKLKSTSLKKGDVLRYDKKTHCISALRDGAERLLWESVSSIDDRWLFETIRTASHAHQLFIFIASALGLTVTVSYDATHIYGKLT